MVLLTVPIRAHEEEKRHEYCPCRFRDKSDAERHRESLCAWRYSWSCSVPTYKSAFLSNTTSADACGFCGDEFRRSGWKKKPLLDKDWTERALHLNKVHKFKGCPQVKFHNTNDFRQHLTEIHNAKSGKWIGKLVNASFTGDVKRTKD